MFVKLRYIIYISIIYFNSFEAKKDRPEQGGGVHMIHSQSRADALRCLLARNAIDPAEAAMVGDRDIDIEAGHNAGMRGVLGTPEGHFAVRREIGQRAGMEKLD